MKKCRSVLLIDDDPIENLINRKLVQKLEISENIEVLSNGHEGLNYLRILSQLDTPPDLIFLDLNMPVMDGFEFLKHFSQLPENFRKGIKVIVLTSSLNESDFNIAKAIGCDGYLIKPLTKEKIQEEFNKIYILKS